MGNLATVDLHYNADYTDMPRRRASLGYGWPFRELLLFSRVE